MKVVINKCYGGFGFSDEFKYHLLLNAPELFEQGKPAKYYGSKKKFDDVLSGKGETGDKVTNDFGDFLGLGWSLGGISVFYQKSTETLYNLTHNYDNDFRSNPKLISLLEEFGTAEASGQFAELKIVEIPDGVGFKIQEYDGVEWIAETHQTWG